MIYFRRLILLILLLSVALVLIGGASHRLDFEVLQQYDGKLIQGVKEHFLLFSLAYVGIYSLATALSIPGAVWLTVIAGHLFGVAVGMAIVLCGATLGASILFWMVRFSIGEYWLKKAGSRIKKIQKGFQDNAFYYLLFLRLIPLFPFWLVNLAAALLKIPYPVFFLSTFFGIIPGAWVYLSLGKGLGDVLKEAQAPDPSIVFHKEILLPLLGLSILALLPVFYKKWIQKS